MYGGIFARRMQLLPVIHHMERRGVTLCHDRVDELCSDYRTEAERAGQECCRIASLYRWRKQVSGDLYDALGTPYDLKLPKSGNNGSLLDFCFKVMKLPVIETTDSGAPSLNAAAMDRYLGEIFKKGDRQFEFIDNLRRKRQRDTAISYMDGYKRFSIPYVWKGGQAESWHRLHPNLNPTGTITLRCSSSNPNMQNFSHKEVELSDGESRSNRFVFGPAPDREWWSFDAKNIERRLPAYKAGEDAVIALFEKPDDPPYFGSEHLLMSHVIYPREFEECRDESGELDGRIFRKKYKPTLYDRVKRGNFAVQNGAQMRKADATYGVSGAFNLIKKRFDKQEALNQRCVDQAEELGYVETMPDSTVDPERGYPIMCARTSYGRIEPTKPFSYYIQGTAMWWMMQAMIRCHDLLSTWNRGVLGDRYFLIMQVHDELVFDFPRGTGPEPWKTNLWRAEAIQRAMEKGGEGIGIHVPVSREYHTDNYSEGMAV